jgi:hypothetical protein
MTIESPTFVHIRESLASTVRKLREESEAALRRSAKLPPGDLSEVRRYDGLQSAIERCALMSLWAGEPYCSGPEGAEIAGSWIADGAEMVELRLPHGKGDTELAGVPGTGPPAPLSAWRSRSRSPRDAMAERFRQLVASALSDDSAEHAVLRPSGITNSVLTETLREFVHRSPGDRPICLPVRYMDGSLGPDFPFRAVTFVDSVPSGWRRLRFTLLSIRHVEMDSDVDGAWLRNAKISQRRPAGQTDKIVHETSLRQLHALAELGPVQIDLFQTGLETAVVGFYRAVAQFLIDRPGNLAVTPHYYRGPRRFDAGSPWATA